jgi:hypothetical protein
MGPRSVDPPLVTTGVALDCPSVGFMGRNSRCDGEYQPLAIETYRRGDVVGSCPALHRLTVRQISNRYLPEEEPITIADLRRRGLSIRRIAAQFGRTPSTISREWTKQPLTAPLDGWSTSATT